MIAGNLLQQVYNLVDTLIVGKFLGADAATGVQQSVMNFGILMIQGLVNSFGPAVMASFAAAVKIDTIAYMPAQEFGNAYSLFVSQNYGANKKERIKKGTHMTFATSALFCAAISAIICIFADRMMEQVVFFTEKKVREQICYSFLL